MNFLLNNLRTNLIIIMDKIKHIVSYKSRYKKRNKFLENCLKIGILISILINIISIITIKDLKSNIKVLCIMAQIIFLICLLFLFQLVHTYEDKKIVSMKTNFNTILISYSTMLIFYVFLYYYSYKQTYLIHYYIYSDILSIVYHVLFIFSIRALYKQSDIRINMKKSDIDMNAILL